MTSFLDPTLRDVNKEAFTWCCLLEFYVFSVHCDLTCFLYTYTNYPLCFQPFTLLNLFSSLLSSAWAILRAQLLASDDFLPYVWTSEINKINIHDKLNLLKKLQKQSLIHFKYIWNISFNFVCLNKSLKFKANESYSWKLSSVQIENLWKREHFQQKNGFFEKLLN